MHNNEFSYRLLGLLKSIHNLLPILFWLLLIYAFDDPHIAALTVGCALIHEGGHLTCALLLGKRVKLRGDVSGFRISGINRLNYNEELLLYLSGPFTNLLCATLCFIPETGSALEGFAAVNLATALANLLPVKGQDGYGALRALIEIRTDSPLPFRILNDISFALTAFLSLFSLYLMQKCDAGYWICAIFLVSVIVEIRGRLQ